MKQAGLQKVTTADKQERMSKEEVQVIMLLPIINGFEVEPILVPNVEGSLKIGRAEDNDIILPIMTASRYHATITRKENQLYIEDLKSSHGTFIGHTQLEPFIVTELKNGDLLRFSTENAWYEVLIENGSSSIKIEGGSGDAFKGTASDADYEFAKKYEQKQESKSRWQIYLDLLEQHKKEKQHENTASKQFSWGMLNDDEIYHKKVEDEVLNANILMMLPGLSENQLSKITQFKKKLKALQILEDELEGLQLEKEVAPQQGEKYDDPKYFEDNNFEDSNKKGPEHNTRNSGTYRLWELRQKINKSLNEVSDLENQLKFSIFGSNTINEEKEKNSKIIYSENPNLIDETINDHLNHESPRVPLNIEDSSFNLDSSEASLASLIKKRIFLEENLISLSLQNTFNDFDLLDEYERFLAETKELGKCEAKIKLINDLKIINEQINSTYEKLKNNSIKIESLDQIHQRIKFELNDVIKYIKHKEKMKDPEVEQKTDEMLENIDEVDYLNDEEEIIALNKRKKLGNNKNEKDHLEVDYKKVKNIGVASRNLQDDRIIEYVDPQNKHKEVGFSQSDTQKVEDHFKKLGY